MGSAHGHLQELLGKKPALSAHIPVVLVARTGRVTQQPQSHGTGAPDKCLGVERAGAAYTVGGCAFPTEKGTQPLVPIPRQPVTPETLQEQP